MPERTNYRYLEPLEPGADKACRLTQTTAAAREQAPEDFFASATAQQVLPNGYELRFVSRPDTTSRIETFIAEEQECCPFFAFERWEEDGQHVLRILRLDDEWETPETLPAALRAPGQAGDSREHS